MVTQWARFSSTAPGAVNKKGEVAFEERVWRVKAVLYPFIADTYHISPQPIPQPILRVTGATKSKRVEHPLRQQTPTTINSPLEPPVRIDTDGREACHECVRRGGVDR